MNVATLGILLCGSLALGGAGCAGTSDPTTLKSLSGNYAVTITTMGRSDPDFLTVSAGAMSKVLFTFTAGITTDPMGPNPSGLRASLDGAMLKLDAQPARIEHSTGTIEGTVTGTGTLTRDGVVALTMHLAPSNFAIQNVDGGSVSVQDGGAVTLDYELAGKRQ